MNRGLALLLVVALIFLVAPVFVKHLTVVDAPFQLQKVVHVRVPVDYNLIGSYDYYLLNFTGCYPYILLWNLYFHDGNFVSKYVLFDARNGVILTTGDWTRCYGCDPVSGVCLFHNFVVIDDNVFTYELPDCFDLAGQSPSYACKYSPFAYRDGYVYVLYAVAQSDQEGAFDSRDPVEYNLYTGLVRVRLSDNDIEELDRIYWGEHVCPSGAFVYSCFGMPYVDINVYGSMVHAFVSYYAGEANYVDVWDVIYDLPEYVGKYRVLKITDVPPSGTYYKYGRVSSVGYFADRGYVFVLSSRYVYVLDDIPTVVSFDQPFDVIDDANGVYDTIAARASVVRNAIVTLISSVPGDRLTRIGYYTSDGTAHVFLSFRRDELGLQHISRDHLAEYDGNGAIVGFGDYYVWFVSSELNDPENRNGYLDAYIFSYNKPVVLPASLADYVSFPIATGPLEVVVGQVSGQQGQPPQVVETGEKKRVYGVYLPEHEVAPPVEAEAPVHQASPLVPVYGGYLLILVTLAVLIYAFLRR